MLMNKTIALFLVLIYFSPLVLGAVVSEPTDSPQTSDPVMARQVADLSAKIQALSQKMDTFATKDQVSSMLQVHLTLVNQLLSAFQSVLMIGFIVIGACLIATWYGVYLYFKMNGRL